jgi:phosphoenolpyruvate carboxylase
MLPAWLGWEAALSKALERGEGELLGQMREQWPFFHAIDMLEMVLAKADADIARPTTSVWCSRTCCHWVRTYATYCRRRARWCLADRAVAAAGT